MGEARRLICCYYLTADFDVEAAQQAGEPPLVTATPIDYYAATASSSSLPTPAEAISSSKINAAAASAQQSPPPLGRHPTMFPSCPHCGATNVMTRTSTYPSIETWLLCVGILLLFWPAFWIPLVMDSAKTTDHFCTSCNATVGKTRPFSDCCVKERG